MKYRKNNYIYTPHGNSIIWRYMSQWKLEKLIQNSELFLSNATNMTDEYEVAIPYDNLVYKQKELKVSGLSSDDSSYELARYQWENKPMKDLVLLNCWSMSPYESYALWKIYLGGERNGIAIKSTVSSLKKSLEKGGDTYSEDFFLGKVQYSTFIKPDELSRLSIITTKKPYYDFEKELRLFIMNYLPSEGGNPHTVPYDIKIGRTVKVDLNVLIHELFISPFADEKYIQKIQNMFKNSKINIKLMESEIRDK